MVNSASRCIGWPGGGADQYVEERKSGPTGDTDRRHTGPVSASVPPPIASSKHVMPPTMTTETRAEEVRLLAFQTSDFVES